MGLCLILILFFTEFGHLVPSHMLFSHLGINVLIREVCLFLHRCACFLEEAWQPTPVFLPVESHGQRSLAGHSPQGRKELNTTKVT